MRYLYLLILSLMFIGCASNKVPNYDCASITLDSFVDSVATRDDSSVDNFVAVLEDLFVNKNVTQLERAAAYYCLAEREILMGNDILAIELYNKSINHYHRHPLPYLSLATIHEAKGDYLKALGNIDTCIEIDDSLQIVNLIKARINLAIGEYDEALKAIYAEKDNSVDSGASLSIEELHGDILSSLHRYEEAAVAYGVAIDVANAHSFWNDGDPPQFFPKQLSLYEKLINAYCLAGMHDDAKNTLVDAVRRNAQINSSSLSCGGEN